MTIKYAGPRPVITHHGVEFKDGKEDKYVYLKIGIEILKAIDHEHVDNKSYSHDIDTKELTDAEMLDILISYEYDLELNTEKEIDGYSQHLESESDQISHKAYLSDIEKEIWIKNLTMMKSYRTQRAVNKIYYMHCIRNIINIIKIRGIKEIDTPFSEKYWHVLQTIQGSLENDKTTFRTDLVINETKDKQLEAVLKIE